MVAGLGSSTATIRDAGHPRGRAASRRLHSAALGATLASGGTDEHSFLRRRCKSRPSREEACMRWQSSARSLLATG